MRIKKLELKHGYKRFHHLTIDLGDKPARIVALVGPNGTGKSSVLDGVLFRNNVHGQIGDQGTKDHNYHSMDGTTNYNYQSISIDFDRGNFNTARQQREKAGKPNTVFSFRSCYRYNANVKIHEVRAVPAISQNNYGATASVDLDECQVIYFREGIRYAADPVILKPVSPSLMIWREIFSTALDDLAGLVSPRRVIYCEGRAEPGRNGRERGLDADVLNAIFASAYPDTQFVSSGGNTELDQRAAITIGIISKVLPTLEIWILKDRDIASGKKTTEKDRLLYLVNNPPNHRVLKRWEIENYLYDREVLEAYCAASGLTFDVNAYTALVTDINDDNLKDETAKIKNICGIITSINPDTFKRNLAAAIVPTMAVYQELEECIFQRK